MFVSSDDCCYYLLLSPLFLFQTHNALILDAVMTLAKGLEQARKEDSSMATRSIDCDDDNDGWADGRFLRQTIIKLVSILGESLA